MDVTREVMQLVLQVLIDLEVTRAIGAGNSRRVADRVALHSDSDGWIGSVQVREFGTVVEARLL